MSGAKVHGEEKNSILQSRKNITLIEHMTFIFVLGLLVAGIWSSRYEVIMVKENLNKIYVSINPCILAVEKSYTQGSSNLISDSVRQCEKVNTHLVKVKTVNVNGVVNIDNWHPSLGKVSVNLVPMIDNDLAEIADKESQIITAWRCDPTRAYRQADRLLESRLCDLLNKKDKS